MPLTPDLFRALGALCETPDPEPDHLAALLGLYAALAEHARTDPDPARAALWHQARRALLWEHLLTWVPPYTAAAAQAGARFYNAWARLLAAALSAEAQALPAPPTTALHLRDPAVPPDTGAQQTATEVAHAR